MREEDVGLFSVVASGRARSIIHSVVIGCTFDTAIIVIDICVDDRCANATRKDANCK